MNFRDLGFMILENEELLRLFTEFSLIDTWIRGLEVYPLGAFLSCCLEWLSDTGMLIGEI